MKVGVLALQGAVREHTEALDALSAEVVAVKTPEHLEAVDALVMPGGESTTIGRLLGTAGLIDHLSRRIDDGLPVLGTCAGMILLARGVADGRPDQPVFGAIDIDVRRNGYGRQRESFERPLDVEGVGRGFPGVFIRAPTVERVGADVTVLAEVDGAPVMCRQGAVTVCAFHPELSGDLRIHAEFLNEAAASAAPASGRRRERP